MNSFPIKCAKLIFSRLIWMCYHPKPIGHIPCLSFHFVRRNRSSSLNSWPNPSFSGYYFRTFCIFELIISELIFVVEPVIFGFLHIPAKQLCSKGSIYWIQRDWFHIVVLGQDCLLSLAMDESYWATKPQSRLVSNLIVVQFISKPQYRLGFLTLSSDFTLDWLKAWLT